MRASSRPSPGRASAWARLRRVSSSWVPASLFWLTKLAARPEVPHRPQPGAEAVLERLDMLAEGGLLAVVLDEGRLIVEQVDVAGGAGHEELHHALGPRSEVRRWAGLRLARQQRGERD